MFHSISDIVPNLRETLFGIFYDLEDILSNSLDLCDSDFMDFYRYLCFGIALCCSENSNSLAVFYFCQESLDAAMADKQLSY